MGYFYGGVLIGPAVAPAVAGVMSEYVKPEGFGWRAMQWLLFAMGVLASGLCVACFPETSHLKGIEVLRAERGEEAQVGRVRKWRRDWVWLNPLEPLKLLMLPHILAMVSFGRIDSSAMAWRS